MVDGQQRLTSFQLFLAALREVGAEMGLPDLGPVIDSYLYVPAMHGDKGTDARFRLIPTPEDRHVFHLLIEAGLSGVRLKHPEWFFQNGTLGTLLPIQ